MFNRSLRRRARPALVTADKNVIRFSLGNTGRNCPDADLADSMVESGLSGVAVNVLAGVVPASTADGSAMVAVASATTRKRILRP